MCRPWKWAAKPWAWHTHKMVSVHSKQRFQLLTTHNTVQFLIKTSCVPANSLETVATDVSLSWLNYFNLPVIHHTVKTLVKQMRKQTLLVLAFQEGLEGELTGTSAHTKLSIL